MKINYYIHCSTHPHQRAQHDQIRPGSSSDSDAVYTCTDNTIVHCKCETIEVDYEVGERLEMKKNYGDETHSAPKNGILLRRCSPPAVFVSGAQVSRDMKVIIRGGVNKTCTFPNTAVTVGEYAF